MINADRIELLDGDNNFGLVWGFQVNPSSCGNHEHYENYIRFMALDDRRMGKGTTHVFIRNSDSGDELLGYITLRATSYTKIVENTICGNPALEIFELAVSKNAERQKIGSELVKFALATAYELNLTSIGVQYVTLCADEKAVPFYKTFGFERIDEQGEIPREQWNIDCVPMILKMPELN